MPSQPTKFDLARRAHAAGIHLLLSMAIAAAAASVVFGLWYPGFYRTVSGGRDLFILVTGVDIVMGPLLTFAVFNPAKGIRHLRRDLAVIGALQFAALLYGLHTVYVVRPVALVFEVDRFRVITAAGVYQPELPKARAEYRSLPLTGPWLLGTRAPVRGDEATEALRMSLQGINRADRPPFWQPYADSLPDVMSKSRPVKALLERYPARAAEFRSSLAEFNLDPAATWFLPMMARGEFVALLDSEGAVRGYLRVDGFV